MQTNNYCANCGAPATELHHIVPLALGGNDINSNTIYLCSKCHALIHGMNVKHRGIEWQRLQRAGIEKAKLEGKYKGRVKIPINEELFISECAKWRAGQQTAIETMTHIGLKPNTFYRRVKEYGI